MVQISTRILVAALAAAPIFAAPLAQSIEEASDVAARDFDGAQVEARSPFIGHIFGGIKKSVHPFLKPLIPC